MDTLLLVSLFRYLDESFANDARRLKHSKGENASTAGDPKQPTKTLQQRQRPTLNESQEIIVIKRTFIPKTVIPLQNLRPGYSLTPQGCYQSADPRPTRYPQVQQSFGQSQQGFRQLPQDFKQSSQDSRQFTQGVRQFSHDWGGAGQATRQFSQNAEQPQQYHRRYSPGLGQLPQAERQPAQGFGQAPPQNYGQSPEGYPQLSSLGYRHELSSLSSLGYRHEPSSLSSLGYRHEPSSLSSLGYRHESSSLSSLGYRHEPSSHVATAWVNDPASPDESRWKRPIPRANTTAASHGVRFSCRTKVHLLGALLGFAGLLYFLM